jgi:aminopeptidase-like protein
VTGTNDAWSLGQGDASPTGLGGRMHDLLRELLPLPRSRTGNGVRATLSALGRDVPLELVEVATGTQLFDWAAPDEWNVREAWIEAPDGTRVVDVARSPLHLVGYSVPVEQTLSLDALLPHLSTCPERPAAIPYRVDYSGTTWGFCLSQRQLESLTTGQYRVRIDATLGPGHLTYGETIVRGTTDDVFLLQAPICHPGLANDGLSGTVLLWGLAQALEARHELRHTYRLVWAPSTIGPLAWLDRNRDALGHVRHGLAVSCVGDPGPLHYKETRLGRSSIDAIAHHVLRHVEDGVTLPWHPWGGDARQFCSPGFDLPVGTISRSTHGTYPEYHTSDDDLSLVTPEALEASLQAVLRIVEVAEDDRLVTSLAPFGEPRLGARGLFAGALPGAEEKRLFWVLSLGDGAHTLLDIAERSGVPFSQIAASARRLEQVGLVALDDVPRPAGRQAT